MSRKDYRMLELAPEGIERYATDHSTPESDIFQSLTEQTQAESDSPQMLVGPIEGRFLKLIVKAMAARRVLEIGMRYQPRVHKDRPVVLGSESPRPEDHASDGSRTRYDSRYRRTT